MLHINDVTYRIEGRTILEHATAAIPKGHKVGLVGRNGAGKSTLLNLITGVLAPDDGAISAPRDARIGQVAQEAPGGERPILDEVLAADKERADLLARAESETAPNAIAEIQTRLADIDAHSAPARAAAILSGLGFPQDQHGRACADFSGGWRMRVALAAALFSAPDVLLLDEPTNYLDLEGIIWLEHHLRRYPHTCVIVSHDRAILNRCAQSILHLSSGKLAFYNGNYDFFEKTRAAHIAHNLKAKKKQDDQRRHLQGFVDRFRAKATKARQAQSRIKALAKLAPVAVAGEERVAPFMFSSPARPKNPPLITLDDVAVGYAPGKPVLRSLSLRIDPDDRIALLGANGNGKSTFAKLLSGALKPESGKLKRPHKLKCGTFTQHQLDALEADQTPYDHIRALMEDKTQAQRRTKLGALGFGHEIADTKVRDLSGGERARLLFALAGFHAPDILILDEPTNHLDVEAREALMVALNDYQGAVILIAHDMHLLEACAERLWIADGGTVAPFDGDLADYREHLLAQRTQDRRKAKNGSGNDNAAAPQNRQAARREAAQARAKLTPLRKKIAALEAEIAAAAGRLAKLDEFLGDPKLYDNEPDRAAALVKERGLAAKQREALEEDWLQASAELEHAQAE